MLYVFTDMENVIFFDLMTKILYNKWLVLTEKKYIEDSIKDGLIITTGVSGIFFGLKAASVKLLSLDTMFIVKLACGIVCDVLVKDYAVYSEWINE